MDYKKLIAAALCACALGCSVATNPEYDGEPNAPVVTPEDELTQAGPYGARAGEVLAGGSAGGSATMLLGAGRDEGPEELLWSFDVVQDSAADTFVTADLARRFKHYLVFDGAAYDCAIGNGDWLNDHASEMRIYELTGGGCFTMINEFESVQAVTEYFRAGDTPLNESDAVSTARPDRQEMDALLTGHRFVVRNTIDRFSPMADGVVTTWELVRIPQL